MKKIIISIFSIIFLLIIYISFPSCKNLYHPKPITSTTVPLKLLSKNEKLTSVEKDILSHPIGGFTVLRKNNELMITSPSGKTNNYIDILNSDNADALIKYYVVEYKKSPEMLVIYIEHYEGSSFKFIQPNGQETPSNHYLYFSPSGNRAIEVNYADAYSFDGWAVLEKNNDTFIRVISQEPAEYNNFQRVGLYFQNWEAEDTVNVLMEYFINKNNELVNLCTSAKIQYINNTWNLTADLDKSTNECNPVLSSQIPENIKHLVE